MQFRGPLHNINKRISGLVVLGKIAESLQESLRIEVEVHSFDGGYLDYTVYCCFSDYQFFIDKELIHRDLLHQLEEEIFIKLIQEKLESEEMDE